MIRNIVLSAIVCLTVSAPTAFAATVNGLTPDYNARNQVQMTVASCNWVCRVKRAAVERRYKRNRTGTAVAGVRG